MWAAVLVPLGTAILLAMVWKRRKNLKTWGSVDRSNEVSAKGKIVLITGANAGIGKETAREFASRDAVVVMACRDLKKAEEAVAWIRGKTSAGELVCMKLDLGSLQSVREFCAAFKAKYDRLDILVNNGGVQMPGDTVTTTKEGFEIHMGINHLGHFLLTNLLLEELAKGAPSRIVTVSSELHAMSPLDLDDIMGDKDKVKIVSVGPIQMAVGYCRSKLANALFNHELAARLEGTGIRTYAVTPGLVMSDLHRHESYCFGLIGGFLEPIVGWVVMKTSEQGAQTTIHAALSKAVMNESGRMYQNCGDWPQSTRPVLKDEDAKKLWEVSAKLVGLNESVILLKNKK